MKKLLIVLSSVRESRAADKILAQVQEQLTHYPDIEATVADFKKLPLPFFDAPENPSSPDFEITDKNVQQWRSLVIEADVVMFLTAEYNHSYTPVVKNAIDWLYKEWNDKPVAFIGYGWAGGSRAIKHLRDVFGSSVAPRVLETEATLHFTKDIDLDGTPLGDNAAQSIDAVLKAL